MATPRVRLVLVFAALALILGSPLRAGTGTLDTGAGTLDLTVYFPYKETDFTPWQRLFTRASQTLYRATDRSLRFGEIRFSNCECSKNDADIVVEDSAGRAGTDGRLGQRERHIRLYKQSDLDADLTLVHELGHYVFDLDEEYGGVIHVGGPGGPLLLTSLKQSPPEPLIGEEWSDLPGDGRFFCATLEESNPVKGCIMDASDSAGLGGSRNPSRTNFCLDLLDGSGHNFGVYKDVFGLKCFSVTEQHEKYRASCWSLISQKLGRVPPVAPPADAGTPPAEPEFQILDRDAYVLCLDRSGSMKGSGILAAKKSGFIVIDSCREPEPGPPERKGDLLAQVSFNRAASTDLGLTEMDAAGKGLAAGAVAGLVADGGTAIGDGMRAAFNILRNADPNGSKFCSRHILVATDGANESGESQDEVAADCKLFNILVHNVGITGQGITAQRFGEVIRLAGADDSALSRVSNLTGGTFVRVTDAADLPVAVAQIFRGARGEDVLARDRGTVAAGSTRPVPITVDALSPDLGIVFAAGITSSPVELRLTRPDGTAVDLVTPPAGVRVARQPDVVTVDVAGALPGTWTATIDATGHPSQSYDLLATGLSRTLQVSTRCDQSEYVFPAAMRITAEARLADRIAGASVIGTVVRADGSAVAITLHDDGDVIAHGDRRPGDGVYSAFFSEYAGSGTYTFNLAVDCPAGRTAPDTFHGNPGIAVASKPVPAFKRVVLASATLSGAPTGASTALRPPAKLAALSTQKTVRLAWTDTNGGLAAHRVERAENRDGPFSNLATVSSGAEFSDTTGAAHRSYFYRVLATSAAGESLPSEVVAATLEDPTVDFGAGGDHLWSCQAGRGSASADGGGPGALLVPVLFLLAVRVRASIKAD